jgi:protein-disulfide isomerase
VCGLLLLTLALPVRPAVAAAAPPEEPPDLRDHPALGRESAPVLVVEISSFKCAHCRTFHREVFPHLRERYINPGQVRWVVLNASDDPADQHARIFAVAACAHRQGKYWEILDSLLDVAHRAPSFLDSWLARSPVMDRTDLEACLRDRTVRAALAGDFALYAALKARGTPTFLLWKRRPDGGFTRASIEGGQKLEYFQRVLDALIASP